MWARVSAQVSSAFGGGGGGDDGSAASGAADVADYWAADDGRKLADADRDYEAKAVAARRESFVSEDYGTEDLTPAELSSLGKAMFRAKGDEEKERARRNWFRARARAGHLFFDVPSRLKRRDDHPVVPRAYEL